MSKTIAHDAAVKEESTDRFSSDLDELKTNFNQLRQDVTRLLENATGTAKRGAGMLNRCGVESIERVEQRISEKPLLSTTLAAGIGFVIAKVFMPHR
jgi:ElaB/YqjD/DUF883 family membrane-anchored ribosome-binding protein